MHNFGWIKTKTQEALDWQDFANGDVLAFEEDIQKLIDGSVTINDVITFVVKGAKLHQYVETDEEYKLREVASLKEGVKFKKLWSVKLE